MKECNVLRPEVYLPTKKEDKAFSMEHSENAMFYWVHVDKALITPKYFIRPFILYSITLSVVRSFYIRFHGRRIVHTLRWNRSSATRPLRTPHTMWIVIFSGTVVTNVPPDSILIISALCPRTVFVSFI